MIHGFVKFKENLLLESINESFIYFSPELRSILRNLSSSDKVAKSLSDIEREYVKPDITFLHIDKEGYLSFTTSKNSSKLINNVLGNPYGKDSWFDDVIGHGNLHSLWNNHINRGDNDVYSKSRNLVKIGKLVNRLFSGKFTDKEIENFVNKFKSETSSEGEEFHIVEGDEIEYWYSCDNYLNNDGQLGSSCMANGDPGLFELYTENTQVCRMLILKKGDKITGRALIWKLHSIDASSKEEQDKLSNIEYFMDRQYTNKDSDVEKFRKYAKEQNWIYKTNNNYHSFRKITTPSGDDINVDMSVRVKDISYDYYPYLDTFRRYDISINMLYNDDNEGVDQNGNYILNDTDGGYEEVNSGYYSEWYDMMIPEHDAIYSDVVDSFIYQSESIYIGRGSAPGYYPSNYEGITSDYYTDDFILEEDSIYSNFYGGNIFFEDSVEVVTDIDSDYDPIVDYLHRLDDDFRNVDSSSTWYESLNRLTPNSDRWTPSIMKKLLIDDISHNYVPKVISSKVYSVNDGHDKVGMTSYLTPLDAKILGVSIGERSIRINTKYGYMDNFNYNKSIKKYLPEIYKSCLELKKTTKDLDLLKQINTRIEDLDNNLFIDFNE